MYWDANKDMIVDLLAPEDSEEIGKDEDLGGFVFHMDTVRNDVKRPQRGLITQEVSPHSDDSVSTLRSKDGTVRHTVIQQQPSPIQSSSGTVLSTNRSLTSESYATLDSRITSLASQVLAQQQNNTLQFDAIMKAIDTMNHNFSRNDQSTAVSTSTVRGIPSQQDNGTSDNRS